MAKYSIEVAGPGNEYTVFIPTKTRLRGRWDFRNTSHRRPSEELGELSRVAPVIPGILISLDTTTRKGQHVDPLKETDGGRKVLASVNAVQRRYSPVGEGDKKAYETQIFEELTNDQIKEWMFYMRSLVDQNLAQYVPGSTELPDIQTIRKTVVGKRRKDPMANSREDTSEEKFVDEVTDKKAAATA